MKTWVLGAAALAALAGCAAPMSHLQANDLAQASPEWELCYVAVSGRGQPVLRNAVYAEIDRRRIDCNQHMPMVLARMQADGIKRADDQAQLELGLRMMQAGQPKPAPASPTVTCRSQNMGTYVRTVCN